MGAFLVIATIAMGILFLGGVNGSAGVPLTNGIIGPWAIANGYDFATYDPVQGVGAKVALSVLATLKPAELATAIAMRDKAMVAQVFLAKGAIVPEHHHESEQITYILEGALQFEIGGRAIVV